MCSSPLRDATTCSSPLRNAGRWFFKVPDRMDGAPRKHGALVLQGSRSDGRRPLETRGAGFCLVASWAPLRNAGRWCFDGLDVFAVSGVAPFTGALVLLVEDAELVDGAPPKRGALVFLSSARLLHGRPFTPGALVLLERLDGFAGAPRTRGAGLTTTNEPGASLKRGALVLLVRCAFFAPPKRGALVYETRRTTSPLERGALVLLSRCDSHRASPLERGALVLLVGAKPTGLPHNPGAWILVCCRCGRPLRAGR
jgi:hypothetical protein